MIQLIVLDEQSRNVVRGVYKKHHALEPIPIGIDFYILNKTLLLNDEIPPGIKVVLGMQPFFTIINRPAIFILSLHVY